MSGYVWVPVPTLGPWIDIPGNSDRANDLMRRNWALVDQTAAVVNRCAGQVSVEQEELLREIWEETLDIERKYTDLLAAENAEYHRSSHAAYFGENYAQVLGWG